LRRGEGWLFRRVATTGLTALMKVIVVELVEQTMTKFWEHRMRELAKAVPEKEAAPLF